MKETKTLTKEEILQIPELIKAKTQKEISEILGVSHGTIHQWVRKMRKSGYDIPKRKGKIGILEKLKDNEYQNDTKLRI